MPLLLIHNINDEQPAYILTSEPIKKFYQKKCSAIIREERLCSDKLFPPVQAFDIETLSWKESSVTAGLPECSRCPASILSSNSKAEGEIMRALSEPQSQKPGKMTSGQATIIGKEVKIFNLKGISRATKLLEEQKKFSAEPSAVRDYHEYRLQPFRVNERAFDMVTNLTLKWMKGIDWYIINSYSGVKFSAEEGRILRIKLDFLTKDYAPSVVNLILRRAIGFFKVMNSRSILSHRTSHHRL